MFSFVTHLASDTSGVPNLLFRTPWVTLLAKAIGKVNRKEVFPGEKPKGYNAISQQASSNTVIVNERDIFNIFPSFRKRAIINDKVALFYGIFLELEHFRYLDDDRIHKGAPSRGVAFESVKGVFSSKTPLIPLLAAKTMDGWNL